MKYGGEKTKEIICIDFLFPESIVKNVSEMLFNYELYENYY